ALFLITLIAGQTYWLTTLQGLPLDLSIADALCCYLLIYGIFLFIRYRPSQYITKYLKYGVVDLIGIILTLAWVYTCKYLLSTFYTDPAYLEVWNKTFFIRGFIGWILISGSIAIHFFVSEFEKYRD